jgi:hypothetical protein
VCNGRKFLQQNFVHTHTRAGADRSAIELGSVPWVVTTQATSWIIIVSTTCLWCALKIMQRSQVRRWRGLVFVRETIVINAEYLSSLVGWYWFSDLIVSLYYRDTTERLQWEGGGDWGVEKSAKWKKLGSLLGAIGHRYEKNGIYSLAPRDLRFKKIGLGTERRFWRAQILCCFQAIKN